LNTEKSFLAGGFVRLHDKNPAMRGKIFCFRGNFFASKAVDSGSVTNFVRKEEKNIRNQRYEVGSFAKNGACKRAEELMTFYSRDKIYFHC
jgi:hypothetical protein